MKRFSFLLISFFSIMFFSCQKSSDGPTLSFVNDGHSFFVKDGRLKRDALITFPEKIKYGTADKDDSFSLLFVLHGANSNAQEIKEITGFDLVAPELNFIVVYPEGISGRWDSISDNDFFNNMITLLSEKYNIKNIYLTGFSAGSIKVFELASALQNRITAIAPVSGLLKNDENIQNLKAIDLLHIHSIDDVTVPMAGSVEEGFYSVEDELKIFKELSKKENLNKDVELFLYETQGHVWNKKSTDLVVDFFYNHPKKDVKLNIQLEAQTLIYNAESKIKANIIVQNPSKIKSINVYSNKTHIFSTEKISDKIQFEFENKTQGMFYLKSEATLDDGQIVYSTLNPFYVNIKNANNNNELLEIVEIKSAQCQSIESQFLKAKNCIDKNFSTRWSSDWYNGQNIIFELDKEDDISKMILFWEMANAKKYDVYTSKDGVEWIKVFEKQDAVGGIEIIDFEKTRAKFIKLDLIERATQYGFSLWEVFVLK